MEWIIVTNKNVYFRRFYNEPGTLLSASASRNFAHAHDGKWGLLLLLFHRWRSWNKVQVTSVQVTKRQSEPVDSQPCTASKRQEPDSNLVQCFQVSSQFTIFQIGTAHRQLWAHDIPILYWSCFSLFSKTQEDFSPNFYISESPPPFFLQISSHSHLCF